MNDGLLEVLHVITQVAHLLIESVQEGVVLIVVQRQAVRFARAHELRQCFVWLALSIQLDRIEHLGPVDRLLRLHDAILSLHFLHVDNMLVVVLRRQRFFVDWVIVQRLHLLEHDLDEEDGAGTLRLLLAFGRHNQKRARVTSILSLRDLVGVADECGPILKHAFLDCLVLCLLCPLVLRLEVNGYERMIFSAKLMIHVLHFDLLEQDVLQSCQQMLSFHHLAVALHQVDVLENNLSAVVTLVGVKQLIEELLGPLERFSRFLDGDTFRCEALDVV